MRRRVASIRRAGHNGAVVIAFLALVASAPAHAGIGDFVKKVKDKAAKVTGKATDAAAPAGAGAVTFDDVTVELTEERVTKLVAAFHAANAAGASRAELVEKVNKASDERNTTYNKNEQQIRAARNKRDEVEMCLHDGYQEAQDRRSEEYKDKALTDPAIREKFTKAALQHNADAARGDTTAQNEIMKVMMSEIMPRHEDSLAVQKKCGAVPPPLPAEARIEALDRQIASMQNELRAQDEQAADALATGSGLDRQQLGMAVDRIRTYLAWAQSKAASKGSTPPGFSEAEVKALEKHREELRTEIGA